MAPLVFVSFKFFTDFLTFGLFSKNNQIHELSGPTFTLRMLNISLSLV